MTLFRSKAFWTAIVDAVPVILNLVLGQFWPEQQDFILKLWAALQPITIVVIGYFAVTEIGRSPTFRGLLK